MTLSVCMIIKDEEEVLRRCLNCVKEFADEIVIVDTGSSDGSVNIAREFTDKIFYFEWRDDFAAARNFSFSKAEQELVMWLDADDVVSEENIKKIISIKDEMKNYDAAYLRYAVAFYKDKPTVIYERERILRRDKNYRWEGEVHEVISPEGRILHSDATIFHKKQRQNPPMRNLKIFQNMIFSGKKLDERQKFYYGRELFFNKFYIEAAAVLDDFLKGDGWKEDKKEACLTIYYCLSYSGKSGIDYVLKSFLYSEPSDEARCALGEYFFEKGEYETGRLLVQRGGGK